MPVTLQDILAARERIAPYIRRTDTTQMTLPNGCELFIKLENLQVTGAFKVRGAANRILQLTEKEKSAGVLAASAGNHAQGVARAARALELACTIVMPKAAPLSKIAATEALGATVVLSGDSYDEACAFARELEKQTGATFVHPFDDDQVIAGQGTLGLEILEDVPNAGQVLVPLGGGGLAAGVAIAIKKTRPDVLVYGVEPRTAASMKASLDAGHIVTLPSAATIADGIAVKTPGQKTYAYCEEYLDGVVTVDHDDIAKAVLHLLEKGKIVSEGAGAAGVAAAMTGKVCALSGCATVALLSGGNIDVTMIARIIDKGLIRAGRKALIDTQIPDKPGYLSRLLAMIADAGANIVSVQHDRMRQDMPIGEAAVAIEIETRDRDHVREICTRLAEAGYRVR